MESQGWWVDGVGELLDQGDIVATMPFAALAEPAVNLISTSLKGGTRGWAEHGTPKFDDRQRANFLAKGNFELGMILNHGCDIDKPTNKNLLLIPVRPLSGMPEAQREAVRQQKSIPLLYLPDVPNLGDHVADLRLITRVAASSVVAADRLATMTEIAKMRLVTQLIAFFARRDEKAVAK